MITRTFKCKSNHSSTKSMTKKDLAHGLGIDTSMVEQVGSKQLFIVRRDQYKELYSYYTLVGRTCFDENYKAVWLLTTEKYSMTTSKQLTQFANAMGRNGYEIRYSDEV